MTTGAPNTAVTELMDSVGQVRIREGRIQSFRPEILTPGSFAESPLAEGFRSAPAEDFVRWLREHEAELVLLKYGFKIRQETLTESVVHDTVDNVLDRVRADLKSREDPLSALVRGVDEPWEVCLLKLLFEVVRASAPWGLPSRPGWAGRPPRGGELPVRARGTKGWAAAGRGPGWAAVSPRAPPGGQ